MTDRTPNFDKLVDPDLEPAERDRLRRVHELLVEAGPPPELSVELATAPTPGSVHVLRHRRGALVAIAAALGLVAFALGFLVGDGGGPSTERVVAMSGAGVASGASASLAVFEVDDAGNWPMELSVDGLAPSSSGRPYQLWLTKGGELAALCGSFLAEDAGSTIVPMNAPYRLNEFDGWVVVEEGSTTPLLTT